MSRRALRLFFRFLRQFWLSAAVGAAIIALPLELEEAPWFAGVRQGVGAVVVVASLGRALYDTLFFDRYYP